MKKYIVRLTHEQRQGLHEMISTGEEAARKLLHARILLKADVGEFGPRWTDEQISEALDVSTSTLVCSEPLDGRDHWNLRLLADRLVELEVVEQVSHETVPHVLNKNELKPWQKKHWCIPPQANAELVCDGEVLDVYK